MQVVDNDIELGTNRFKTTTGITYDNAGNITADGKFKPSGTTYSYDATNRVVATNNSTAIYDGAGQRVQATESGVTTTSVYDAAGRMIVEYVGGTMREYIYRGSEAIATVESAGVRYYLSDHLGSNRVVMDTAGGVIGRHDYQPFGEELGLLGMRTSGQGYGMNDPMRSKYAGMERETGTDHTLFRKAESKSGRWNSPDPYQGGFSNPQIANRYTYVENDPINATDSLGLSPQYDASFRGYDPDDRWKNPWNYMSTDMKLGYRAYESGVSYAFSGSSFDEGYKQYAAIFFGFFGTYNSTFLMTYDAEGEVSFDGIGANIYGLDEDTTKVYVWMGKGD